MDKLDKWIVEQFSIPRPKKDELQKLKQKLGDTTYELVKIKNRITNIKAFNLIRQVSLYRLNNKED